MDNKKTIQELKEEVKRFSEDRDWDQFHNAKDLAIGIITESSELLEHFRWKSENEVKDLLNNPKKRDEIGSEIADILYFLVRLAQRYDIDLSEVLNKKIQLNEKRYPIEKSKGSNKKYTEL